MKKPIFRLVMIGLLALETAGWAMEDPLEGERADGVRMNVVTSFTQEIIFSKDFQENLARRSLEVAERQKKEEIEIATAKKEMNLSQSEKVEYFLDLTQRRLRTLTTRIQLFPLLTTLLLSQNALADLPEEIGTLRNLAYLDLHKNYLKTLPESIAQLTSLTNLSLDKNELKSLPKGIGRLEKLTVLSLRKNQISDLPLGMCGLSSLTHLDLEENNLRSIPFSLYQTRSLTYLTLGYNQIGSIDPDIGNLAELRHLILFVNQLRCLPNELNKMVNLKVLQLEKNPTLKKLPSLAELPHLIELSVDGSILIPAKLALKLEMVKQGPGKTIIMCARTEEVKVKLQSLTTAESKEMQDSSPPDSDALSEGEEEETF
jgi:Leucine-rich repeat (LRR) protein